MRTRPRPFSLVLSLIAPAALLYATTGCAQWSQAPATAAAVHEAADLVVVTAERHDEISRAQAVAIRSFNKEALDPLGIAVEPARSTPISSNQ